MSFLEEWLDVVDNSNSVLCAGLDPAEFEMDRKEKGLPEGVTKRDWALKYVEAVAPFSAALKPNYQYWKGRWDNSTLEEVADLARELGLIVIDDSKLADIGSTNEAGLYHSSIKHFDAVTFSPFAGNMAEAAAQAKKWEIGLIPMCLMSSPEYEREKNKWVDISDTVDDYDKADIVEIEGLPHVRQYIQLAREASFYGASGIVIGAPKVLDKGEENERLHPTPEEIANAASYSNQDMLVLLPGVGEQGGQAQDIYRSFAPDKVIVNVGRSLMLPNGSNSTPAEQAETAQRYQKMLNNLRAA